MHVRYQALSLETDIANFVHVPTGSSACRHLPLSQLP